MPWKLIPPHVRKDGKTIEFYYVRGKYLGIALDKSTGTADGRAAKTTLATWRKQAERGEFSKPTEVAPEPDYFLAAANAYMDAGGQRKFINPIIAKWKTKLLAAVDQIAIDTLAELLHPGAPASTKNRQVYTPVSAILKHVGVETKIRRPKNWRGNKRTFWLKPEPTFRLLDAASHVDAEFGVFCTMLNYCGLRLGEGFAFDCASIDLQREYGYLPTTKTDEPRAVYLPPVVVTALANHPRGLDRKGRLFKFYNGSRLYKMLDKACELAEVELPGRTAFHVFRHNYGTWMRLYGGLDSLGLLRTDVWKDMESVDRYSHSEPSAEARAAAKLPTPQRGQVVDILDGRKKA